MCIQKPMYVGFFSKVSDAGRPRRDTLRGYSKKIRLGIFRFLDAHTLDISTYALGVSVKSVHVVAGRLEFYSQSGHTKDFKNSMRSFRARRLAQAEVRRVLCICCS